MKLAKKTITRKSTRVQRTFILFGETASGRNGYVRFKVEQGDDGEYEYEVYLTDKVSLASVYTNLERLKESAKAIKSENSLTNLEIIDMVTGKHHVVP